MTSQTALRDARPEAPAELKIDVVSRDDVAVVVVAGEIDLATSETFEASLARAVRSDRPVVIDLCEVSFMGMAGLRAVLATRTSLTATGRALALACRPRGVVARVIELSGSAGVLAPQPSRYAAVRALAPA